MATHLSPNGTTPHTKHHSGCGCNDNDHESPIGKQKKKIKLNLRKKI